METAGNTTNTHKSFCIRNLPNSLYFKMKETKEKNGFTFTRQIREALKFWFENSKTDE